MSEQKDRGEFEKIVHENLLRTKEATLMPEFMRNGCCVMCGFPVDPDVMREALKPMIEALKAQQPGEGRE